MPRKKLGKRDTVDGPFAEKSPMEVGEPIRTLGEFVSGTELLDLLAHFVLFRGQPVEGGLLPNIARDDPKKDTGTTERKMLEQLKLQGASFIDSFSTDLDLLILAQHWGLKTRLLDWTSNPLIALWFACADPQEGDVYVYALLADGLLAEGIYEKNPLDRPKTAVIQPRLNNPRLVAQHGWFTLHRFSKANRRFVPLEKNKDLGGLLWYRIVGEARPQILKSLDRHGINARTIFPDLGGLCQHLNWLHQNSLALDPGGPAPQDNPSDR